MVPFLKEYRKALFLRILVFAFLGMGWDVLMTTVQMILGGFFGQKRRDDGKYLDVSCVWIHSSGGLPHGKAPSEG